jgi:hypothetical protein
LAPANGGPKILYFPEPGRFEPFIRKTWSPGTSFLALGQPKISRKIKGETAAGPSQRNIWNFSQIVLYCPHSSKHVSQVGTALDRVLSAFWPI